MCGWRKANGSAPAMWEAGLKAATVMLWETEDEKYSILRYLHPATLHTCILPHFWEKGDREVFLIMQCAVWWAVWEVEVYILYGQWEEGVSVKRMMMPLLWIYDISGEGWCEDCWRLREAEACLCWMRKWELWYNKESWKWKW